MAGGINQLIQMAAGSLAKDKISSMLTPNQLELANFLMSPQYYIAEKGVNKIADLLGYGSDYRQLKNGAEDEKAYGKEVMRDTVGDMLPGAIGNFVRATPKNTDIDNTPAGVYYDPNVGDFVQSPNPVISSDPFVGDRFAAKVDPNSVYNTDSQTYMGPANPKDMNSSIYSGNLTDLLEMLGPYEQQNFETPAQTATQSAPIDFGGTMDYSDVFGGSGGGGKLEDYASSQYRQGGRVCSCHK